MVWVEDVGSMHGLKLNNKTIKPHFRERLIDGDVLKFGAEVSRGTGMSSLTNCFRDFFKEKADIPG